MSTMPGEQIIIGTTVTVLCALGWLMDEWFLDRTKKGKRLVGWFGRDKAVWVLRIFFAAGILFGTLLAADVIRPVRW